MTCDSDSDWKTLMAISTMTQLRTFNTPRLLSR